MLQTLLDNILYQKVKCKASVVKIQLWVESDPVLARHVGYSRINRSKSIVPSSQFDPCLERQSTLTLFARIRFEARN